MRNQELVAWVGNREENAPQRLENGVVAGGGRKTPGGALIGTLNGVNKKHLVRRWNF